MSIGTRLTILETKTFMFEASGLLSNPSRDASFLLLINIVDTRLLWTLIMHLYIYLLLAYLRAFRMYHILYPTQSEHIALQKPLDRIRTLGM